MKQIKIYIIALASLFASSCSLDYVPQNAVTFTNFYQSEKDLEAVMTEMNYYLPGFAYTNTAQSILRGTIADDFTYGFYRNIQNMVPSEIVQNAINNQWTNQYKVIYNANLIIDNADRVVDISESRRTFYVAQANFAKAYAYLLLSQIWGDAVITLNSTHKEAYAKSSIIEVIDEAIRCALLAYADLPTYENVKNSAGTALTSKQFGNKGNSAALLAHAYAWRGSIIDLYNIAGEDSKKDYQSAITWCGELITGEVSSSYGLMDNVDDVCSMCLSGEITGKEVIFEIATDFLKDYVSTKSPLADYSYFPSRYGSQPGDQKYSAGMLIKHETVREIYADGDERLNSYFFEFEKYADPSEDLTTGGYAYPNKLRKSQIVPDWQGLPSFGTFESHAVVWRLADIILLRAECYNKVGSSELAIDDLDMIRSRANAELYDAVAEPDLKLAIFKEREKELIFEGHRYIDIIRNNYIKEELKGLHQSLSQQDILDGALFSPVGTKAFQNNGIMRQNVYWLRYM